MGSTSDEWVSAYVAGVIAATSREAADQTLELLLSRRQGQAGWGYHALVPPDADTTTCVLRLAERLGRHDEERFAAARRFVSHLVAPSGGLATYDAAAAAPLSHYMGLETTFEGWCSVHTCVTAAAATLELPVRPRLVGYLARSQREDGGWSGYWWDDDEYTTALACEALAMTAEDHGPALVRASAWAERRIGPDGAVSSVATSSKSAFATALALRSMVSCASGGARPDAAERAIAWLLATQNEDGGWPPSARLRIPEPRSIDPLAMPATTVTYIDEGVFTTATVLSGLAAALVWEPPAP
jgi:squalene cyclase